MLHFSFLILLKHFLLSVNTKVSENESKALPTKTTEPPVSLIKVNQPF